MKTGIVLDIDHFAVHDGPGIRTCLYVKGCPLHCMWCHSPQSQVMEPQILFARSRCIGCGRCSAACLAGCQVAGADEERQYRREGCRQCMNCVRACPTGALFLEGKEMTVEEAERELLADRIFYKNSGGGVTVSGGECLMQAEFTGALLAGLKKEKIHTIVETSGYGRRQDLLNLAEYTDLFYYDYKLADEELFRRYTGGELRVVSENLCALRKKTDRIVLRIPMIPGITDTAENVDAIYRIAEELKIREVHLLPYNESAGAKYEWCGKTYGLEGLTGNLHQAELLKDRAPLNIKAVIMK